MKDKITINTSEQKIEIVELIKFNINNYYDEFFGQIHHDLGFCEKGLDDILKKSIEIAEIQFKTDALLIYIAENYLHLDMENLRRIMLTKNVKKSFDLDILVRDFDIEV